MSSDGQRERTVGGGGTTKSNNNPETHCAAPGAGTEPRQVRQGGGLRAQPLPALLLLHTETLCARREWEAVAPRFAQLPSFLQGLDTRPGALPVGRCPISPLWCQTSHWQGCVCGGVFGGQITLARPSASEPPTPTPRTLVLCGPFASVRPGSQPGAGHLGIKWLLYF